MNYSTPHPVVLETPLQWKDLSEEEQEWVITGIKTNTLAEAAKKFDPVMPMLLLVQFPLNLVDSRHPAGAMGQAQILIEPRASNDDAGLAKS